MDANADGRDVLREVVAKTGGPFGASKKLGISPWSLLRYLHRKDERVPNDVLRRAANVLRGLPANAPLFDAMP